MGRLGSRTASHGLAQRVGRLTVARFKDPVAELPAMARELGIGAVLAGSVRHGGDRPAS